MYCYVDTASAKTPTGLIFSQLCLPQDGWIATGKVSSSLGKIVQEKSSLTASMITDLDLRGTVMTNSPPDAQMLLLKVVEITLVPLQGCPNDETLPFSLVSAKRKAWISQFNRMASQWEHNAEAITTFSVLEAEWAESHSELLSGPRPPSSQATRSPTS